MSDSTAFILKRSALFILGGLSTLFVLGTTREAQARPEYALEHGVVSCTACHVSPAGAGIRTTYGKMYGAFGQPTTQHHLTDLYQADLRAIGFVTEDNKDAGGGGLGIMALIGSVNVPLVEMGDRVSRFVGSYSFGSFSAGLREAYVQMENKAGRLVQTISFGLLNPAFGYRTDEHRTYARIQNNSTYNVFGAGVMVSGLLQNRLAYTLSVVNGNTTVANPSPSQSAGRFQGESYRSILDLRWTPAFAPFMLGASGDYLERHGETEPYSYALYSGLSFKRLTRGIVDATVFVEYQNAKHWNDTLINGEFGRVISNNTAYNSELVGEESEGWLVWVDYDINRRWALHYKFDRLVPSTDFRGDDFNRHGLGFRYQASANTYWLTRIEKAEVGRDGIDEHIESNLDAAWILMHHWF